MSLYKWDILISDSWTSSWSGGGWDMYKATYDPQNIADDAFDRANHTWTQAISTITNLQTELDSKANQSTTYTKTETNTLLSNKADSLTSDQNYVTDAQLVVISNTSWINTWDNAVNSLYSWLATSKQDILVSWTNIKTINGNSLLWSGDLEISWGWGWFLREVNIAWTQYLNTVLFEWAIWKATTLEAAYISCKTAPTWANFVVTVYKSTDNGSTYDSGTATTLTAWSKYEKTAITTAFAEWNWIKATITQIWSTIAWQDLFFSITGS